MSDAPAGPVHDATRQPAEAERVRQAEGELAVAPAGAVLWSLGARALPGDVLARSARPPGRGFRGAQTGYVLQLQRLHGNRDVARLVERSAPGRATVQTKLAVNLPGDPYEQEAERVADAVMRMPAPGLDEPEEPEPIREANTRTIRRACAACDEESLRRSPDVAAPVLRAEGGTGAVPDVTPELEDRIQAMRGGGQPLPAIERSFFEQRLGVDLGGVRVHTDTAAAETSRALQARAYTIGSDIAFGAGEYRPGTNDGRRLLAHELTHVIQQGAAAPLRRAPAASGTAPEAEEGVCPVCGRTGKGRCPGCGAAFVPVQRRAVPEPADPPRSAQAVAEEVAGPRTAAGPSVQRLGLDDVLSLGRDGAINLVAQFSPGLADFLRNGPVTMLVEAIKGGIQSWLRGLLGGVDVGGATGTLVGALSGAFATIRESPDPVCATLTAALDGLRAFAEAIADNPVVKAALAAFRTVAGVVQKIVDVVIGGTFDAVMGIAGGVTDAAKKVWGWIVQTKNALGVAWDTVKSTLGLDEDENGIVAKLKAKAAEGWETIKRSLAPAIGPITSMLKQMLIFSPVGPTYLVIKYLPELVETVQWLWAHKGDEDIVKSSQEAGHTVLPKLLGAMRGLGQGINSVATALAKGAEELHAAVLTALGEITGIPLLSMAQGLMRDMAGGVRQLATLAQTGFAAAAGVVGGLVQKAKTFLEPYIEVLVPLGMATLNPAMIPVILAGKAWRALPDCYKGPIINVLLDAAINLLKKAPQISMFGPLWQVLKAGVIGFLEGVRVRPREEKVRITNKLAKILSGGNPAFLLGYAKGLMIGLWKGLKQPFELAYDLIKLLNFVQTWAEKAGEQALVQALAPAGAPAATPSATGAPTPTPARAPAAVPPTSAPAASAPAATQAPAAGANGAAPAGPAAVQQKLNQMLTELRPPLNQVTTGFMPAMQDVFSSPGKITYADVQKKLGGLLESAESALRAKGHELAGTACKSFLNDKNDEELGEDVGDVAGQVLFEVILFVLTEGLIEALKPLQGIAKLLDWAGEAFGAALKWLGKLGGWVLDGVKGLWRFVEHSGAGKRVVRALEQVGEIIVRYVDELMGLGGKAAGREGAEAAGGKAAKAGAEEAGGKLGSEGAQHLDDLPVNQLSNAKLAEAGVPVRIGDIDHTMKPVRVGDRVQIWLCTTCSNMVDRIDAVLARISDSGPTKSLHARLTNLRGRVLQLEADINAKVVPFDRIPAESNQLAVEMQNISKKFPGFEQELNLAKITRPDPSDYAALAERLGFQRTGFRSHGQAVFERDGLYITPDVDSHIGGVWKMADSPRNLGSKRTRMGTYDADLNRIGD